MGPKPHERWVKGACFRGRTRILTLGTGSGRRNVGAARGRISQSSFLPASRELGLSMTKEAGNLVTKEAGHWKDQDYPWEFEKSHELWEGSGAAAPSPTGRRPCWRDPQPSVSWFSGARAQQ